MGKQDASIKGNPYSAEFRNTTGNLDYYTVLSASSSARYLVTLDNLTPDNDHCSCKASVPCWHCDAARLMQQVERVTANSEAAYRNSTLAELQAADAQLHALLAEADSWLVRAQLGVCGDAILDRLIGAEVAA